VVTDSWIKPCSRWLAIEKNTGRWAIQRFSYKEGKSAREESKKFEVAPKSMSADTGSGRPGI